MIGTLSINLDYLKLSKPIRKCSRLATTIHNHLLQIHICVNYQQIFLYCDTSLLCLSHPDWSPNIRNPPSPPCRLPGATLAIRSEISIASRRFFP